MNVSCLPRAETPPSTSTLRSLPTENILCLSICLSHVVHEVIIQRVHRAELAALVHAVRVGVDLAARRQARLPEAVAGEVAVAVVLEENVHHGDLGTLGHPSVVRQGLAHVVGQALLVRVAADTAEHWAKAVDPNVVAVDDVGFGAGGV